MGIEGVLKKGFIICSFRSCIKIVIKIIIALFCGNIRIISLGGTLDNVNMCFGGKTAIENMNGFYARKGFISCRSISMRYGIMDSNEQIAEVRAAAVQNCYKCYLVADHTKFGNTSLYKIADFELFGAIVTDRPLTAKWMEFLNEKNIKVYYPEDVVYPESPVEPLEYEE